jgi:hypothetical protein
MRGASQENVAQVLETLLSWQSKLGISDVDVANGDPRKSLATSQLGKVKPGSDHIPRISADRTAGDDALDGVAGQAKQTIESRGRKYFGMIWMRPRRSCRCATFSRATMCGSSNICSWTRAASSLLNADRPKWRAPKLGATMHPLRFFTEFPICPGESERL